MKGLIFTYGMTAIGTIGAFVNPFLALLVYVCFAIVKPDAMWYWAVPSWNYSRVVALAMLLSWAMHGFGNWNFGQGRRIVFAYIGFWLWAMLAAVQAPNDSVAWRFIIDMSKIVLPMVAGLTMIDSVTRLKQLAWVIVLSQGYVALEMNLSFYSGFNRMQLAGFAGLDNNSAAIAMVTGFGLAAFLGFYAERWWQKGIALAAALLMAHSVMFAYSRGGMLGLIATGVVTGALFVRQPRHYVMAAVVVLLMLRLAGPEVRSRFYSAFADKQDRDRSATARLEQWSFCLTEMKQHPIFGVGPDHWPIVSQKYGLGKAMEAHSLWLQTAAEIGIPGVLLLMSFYATCIARLWPLARLQAARPGAEGELGYLACAVIGSLIGFAVSASFVSLEGLEIAPYVGLLGAGVLKLHAHGRTAPSYVDVRWRSPAMAGAT